MLHFAVITSLSVQRYAVVQWKYLQFLKNYPEQKKLAWLACWSHMHLTNLTQCTVTETDRKEILASVNYRATCQSRTLIVKTERWKNFGDTIWWSLFIFILILNIVSIDNQTCVYVKRLSDQTLLTSFFLFNRSSKPLSCNNKGRIYLN